MDKRADLVLEGGGVKGIALVGAIEVLEEHGYAFQRTAGTSAGAIVGALVAADIPAKEIVEIVRAQNYLEFQDGPPLCRHPIGKAAAVITRNGVYRGEYLRSWLQGVLEERGKASFGQMTYKDSERPPIPQEAYKLMVTVSDLTSGGLRYLPWQYDAFGRDRDSQPVAEAVRASMSIPFFYRPVRWNSVEGDKTWLVDGGMLSNFPITAFDSKRGDSPRWPTFGIKLSGHPEDLQGRVRRIRGPLSMTRAMISTWTGFFDQMHIESPDARARTIFVRTADIAAATDFDLTPGQRDRLYERGREAAEKFLATWDFEKYIHDHRSSAD